MLEEKRVGIVDLQGFMVGKDFILKELYFSIFNFNDSCSDIEKVEINRHYIFKPPFSYSELDKKDKENALCSLAFNHGIYWNSGHINYSEIEKCIQPLQTNNLVLFVEGLGKVQCLRKVCNNSTLLDIRNIRDYGCIISLRLMSMNLSHSLHCCKHHKVLDCARQNVEIIKNWFRHHQQQQQQNE